MLFQIIGSNEEKEVVLYTNIFKLSKDIMNFIENYDILFFFKIDLFSIKKSNFKKYFFGNYIELRYTNKKIN